MNFNDIKDMDNEYIANTYARFDIAIKNGRGSTLYDYDGKKYIDFSTGIAVNSFGVCDTLWENAVIEQATKLNHVSNLYYSLPQAKLAKMLCERTNMKKVFFANSGAEANECAIKTARKYSSDKYGKDRYEIITLKNSFHGRTIATLAATGQDVFHQNFGPFPLGFKYVTANSIEEMKEAMTDKVCAVIMEMVQGEGGVMPLDKKFVEETYKMALEKDILVIIDEVQTGNGRTGSLYAYMQYGINPDIVTTAKGLAGGLPFGAILFGEKTKGVLSFGDHGSTFGGNPICANAAISILSRIDDKLLEEVKEKSKLIFDYMSGCKNVLSVDGLGLMIGIKTTKNAKDIVKECLNKGLIVLTAKDKIRLLPALNISYIDLQNGLQILREVIEG